VPIQRCWWHLPSGLRKAFYADDASNRHVNPRWARDRSRELGELLREQIRREHTAEQALEAFDAFTTRIPNTLTSAHAYLAAAPPHTFTCLDPTLRTRLARLGGPELGTGVLERLMRELNARTDLGGSRWSVPGLRDLLTVTTARLLGHPAWHHLKRATHRPNRITLHPAETQRSVTLPTRRTPPPPARRSATRRPCRLLGTARGARAEHGRPCVECRLGEVPDLPTARGGESVALCHDGDRTEGRVPRRASRRATCRNQSSVPTVEDEARELLLSLGEPGVTVT
jgi:hypothetical protein